MSAKRRALKQISKDNWEDSDDDDNREQHNISNRDEIHNRKIITAKRRSGSSSFNTSKYISDKSNIDSPLLANHNISVSIDKPLENKSLNKNAHEVIQKTIDDKKIIEFYYKCLEKLNKTVSEWVQKCVQTKPHSDFSPVFYDYFKHLEKLREELNIECTDTNGCLPKESNFSDEQPYWNANQSFTKPIPSSSNPNIGFFKQVLPKAISSVHEDDKSQRFGSFFAPSHSQTNSYKSSGPDTSLHHNFMTSHQSTNFSASKPMQLSFSTQNDQNNNIDRSQKPALWNFAVKTVNNEDSSTTLRPHPTSFNFGGTAKFESKDDDKLPQPSSGSCPQPGGDGNEEIGQDDEAGGLKLPKTDPNQPAWEEAGSSFVRKCKLFRKDGPQFRETGIGFLYVKAMEGSRACSGRRQLLIRADNASGTVLLNAVVDPKTTPVTLSGKNGVIIVLPAAAASSTPANGQANNSSDEAHQPITYLIRVKTAHDASQFREILLSQE